MTIVWNDDLKTGINAIDYQHKLLFETINKLSDVEKKKGIFYEVLVELQVYVSEHFSTEEKFMSSSGYHDYMHHKKCHDDFIVKYKEFFEKIISIDNMIKLVPELITFIESWLNDHYTNEDVKMASYLNKHSQLVSNIEQ